MTATALILILFVIANLPWITDRVFMLWPLKQDKPTWVRVMELLVYYLLGLLIGNAFEWRYSGELYQQGWEFYVITLCLFLLLAVPGVVLRFQWLPQQQKIR